MTYEAPPTQSATEPYPLSSAQRRLWFLEQLRPGGSEYNTSIGYRLHGPLDVGALRAALNGLVIRHESLRTTFRNVDGSGVRVVNPPFEVPLRLREAAPGEETDAALLDEVTRPFDLREGPLVRALLLRHDRAEHLLVLAMHHLVTDGWSMGVLTVELGKLYSAAARGRPATLPPVSYPDPSARPAQPDLDAQIAYWQRQLAGVTPLELPTDRPRPAERSSAGAIHRSTIPAPLTARVAALARSMATTLFTTLAAATQVLLARHSGQRDIAIGAVTSGRDRDDLENLVGFFVNTIVVRAEVDGSASFAEFLGRVRSTVVDAMANDQVPFDRLVELTQPERDASRPPLVQAMVVLQNTPAPLPDLVGVECADLELPRAAALFELSFEFRLADGELRTTIEYSTDLFDAATIARLAEQLAVLLAGIVADPGCALARLPVLPPAERRLVLTEWNDTGTAEPGCLHELFARRALERPDAVAVTVEGAGLTYRELDIRANRLAHALAARGVRPDTLVGLFLPRGADAIVAMLGILKAGGAYVPLDPAYPADRIALLVNDSGLRLVVADAAARDRLPPGVEAVGADEGALAGYPGHAPEVAVAPDNLAYLMYTSGSGGRPKGVLVVHGAVARLCADEHVRFAPADVLTQYGTLSFDSSTFEIWGALLSGARLAVCSETPTATGLAADGVTTLWLTAGMFHEIAGVDLELFGGVRRLLSGGDVLSPQHCGRVVRRFPGLALTNCYGPTEGTAFTTCHDIREADTLGASVPIGRPIIGTRCYVLDTDLNPVPIGAPGELYIGGDGLARGYLNDAGLTAERFVADPFGVGTRLYRSGDVVRWSADGVLHFLGRVDNQVKIRGFRVEVGEIEAALLRHPRVESAVVLAREDIRDHKRLVGYVVPRGEVDPGELRAFLESTLPAYLVPNAFVVVDRMPLTNNGKIDRAALPRPETPADRSYLAPRTEHEEILAQVWAEVLGLEWVGVHDNFFDLGGDSILSIQLVARARQRGLTVTSKQVFLRQTVAGLAASATRCGPGAAPDRAPVSGPVPLTPIQRWFFDTVGDRPEHFNQWIALDLVADVDPDAVRAAVRALVRQHDALRLRFERRDGDWHQDGAAEADTAGCFRRVAPADADPVGRAALFDRVVAETQAGLRLDTGPLLAAVFGELDAGPRLVLIAHHLVVDGISWRILVEDLATAYRQAVAGEDVDLGPRTTSFQDWSRRLCEHVASGALDDQLPYWAEAADGPTEGAGGPPRTITARLPAEPTAALLRDVPAAYRTQINDVLLGAVARVCADWTGRDRVAFDLEGHGREELFDDVDLSRTVGWFTTLFPCALTVPRGGWGTVLKAVKEQLRAVPTRGLGHGALRYLGGHHLGTREALLRFNYLGRFDEFAADGLCRSAPTPIRLDRADPANGSARLDVTASVTADGELAVDWTFSPDVHEESVVRGLAERTLSALAEIIRHCAEPGSGGCTPSDFPLVALGQADLDLLCGNGHDVADVYPLTPMQGGMLFHSLSAPGVYFEQLCFTLTDVADLDALARSWQGVVDTTPALRAAVVWEGLPEPVQVVRRRARLPISRHDWRGLSQDRQDEELRRLLAEDRAAGLDLGSAPLLRLAIARLDGARVRLVWSFHHILLDGWSTFQVLSDTIAGVRGGPIPSARRPFRDHLAWLSEQDGAATEEHWRAVLADFRAPTALPYDRPPGAAHRACSTAAVTGELSVADSALLTAFAKRNRLTVNAIVQGMWALLLAKHSGERDVCFGAVVSGRPADLVGVDTIVGMFINTVPVRVDVGTAGDLVAWLRGLQDAQVESRRFEHVSLAALRRWSGLPAGSNLFDSVIVFENYPVDRDALTADGIQLEKVTAVEITNYPLNLVAAGGSRHTDRLSYLVGYDPELFDRATAEAIATGFRDLVAALARDSVRPVAPSRPRPRRPVVAPIPDEQPYVAPRNRTEQAVARIWADVLAVDRVGANDNFFALGGDSILSIRVAARLRAEFGATLPPRVLFDNPTVGALAMMFEHPTIEAMARLVDLGTEPAHDYEL
ncbi:non-ribosomal peptide synthetase [Solihabitans fulvus]|nr:non-ribosomal peptide synthetase [Solihabitans fulvus]